MADIAAFLHRDPTLDAIDAAIEARQERRPRLYLGMSAIGRGCDRSLWYSFRHASPIAFNAAVLKRFADGHAGEDGQAARLRMVKGVELHTHDETGRQYGFEDHAGHLRGHMDGAIRGLLQAPKTWHVWEHKQVDQKKQDALARLKREKGEKAALEAWDQTYYTQAMLYCHYSGMTRHYLTCSTPGGRHTIGIRTDYHAPTAWRAIERARRIIQSDTAPPRISENPEHPECRWCEHRAVCHEGALPLVSCRTCVHATPEMDGDGRWSCARGLDSIPPAAQRAGCPDHLYLPTMTPWHPVDANEAENSITYEGGHKNGGPDGMTSMEMREMANADL